MTIKTPSPDHLHFFNHHTGRPRFHFEEAAAGAAAGAAGAAGGAASPWHTGLDAELIGHAQNKGWKLDDAKEAFGAAAKVARDLEKHFGVPADRLVKLPAADAKPEEFAAMWQRLGAPKEAKEYDFSGVKFAGNELEPAFADAMRQGLHAASVPKDKASAIVASVVKYLESADTTETTVNAQKLADEKTKLKANWPPEKYDFNHLQAIEGARRLGITPEATKALENQIGYADLMETMRKIGANTREDTFVERGAGGPTGDVTTREGAVARRDELMADKAWCERYTAGGQTEKREMTRLNTMISGEG